MLMEALPAEKPSRSSGKPVTEGESEKSFNTGAYVYSRQCGLRANTRCFPAATCLLASIVSSLFPEDRFSTVALFRNISTPLHRDDNNDGTCDNLLVPCSSFLDGQVWIEGQGTVPCPLDSRLHGSLLETSAGPTRFNASQRHATCPWSGLRLMLVGFQVRCFSTLPAACRDTLCELGFTPDGRGVTVPPAVPACPCAPTVTSSLDASACSRATATLSPEPASPNTPLGGTIPQAPQPPPLGCGPESVNDLCASAEDVDMLIDSALADAFPQRRSPLVIEVFAGTASLSSACSRSGFRTLAIDRVAKQSKFPIQTMDLAQTAAVDLLLDIILREDNDIALIHFAPPCGTASAARAIALPQLQARGLSAPQPLRSLEHPQGLPGLHGTDLQRVDSPNCLYRAVGTIATAAMKRGIRVSVENPANSLAWLCDGMSDLLYVETASEVLFDHCMHGGLRDKCTRWWCSDSVFDSLALRCSKDHPHASWKPRYGSDGRVSFPTHDEAAYPDLLCDRMLPCLLMSTLASLPCGLARLRRCCWTSRHDTLGLWCPTSLAMTPGPCRLDDRTGPGLSVRSTPRGRESRGANWCHGVVCGFAAALPTKLLTGVPLHPGISFASLVTKVPMTA
ncbi:unnamed protein product [Symbiodinium sp. CCMP2456]|nr:unnamed protein product [Symbiodinium sp. CCMP2456]